MLRRLILSAVLGIALGVAAWFLGMDAAHAIGLGAAAFAFSACLSALGEVADVSWAVPAPPLRPGARRDIVQLGWSLGARGGHASPEGIRVLRTVAERALRMRGLELEDRGADEELGALLGGDVVALLRRGSAVNAPRTAVVAAALDRLESLVDDGPRATSPSSATASDAADASSTVSPATVSSGRPSTAHPSPIPTPQEPPRAR